MSPAVSVVEERVMLQLSGRRRHHAPLVLEPFERRLLLTTYYVSPAGSDAADGLSAAAPWQTVEKVNARAFLPGDQILFQGGQTFAPTLAARTNVVADGGFE